MRSFASESGSRLKNCCSVLSLGKKFSAFTESKYPSVASALKDLSEISLPSSVSPLTVSTLPLFRDSLLTPIF